MGDHSEWNNCQLVGQLAGATPIMSVSCIMSAVSEAVSHVQKVNCHRMIPSSTQQHCVGQYVRHGCPLGDDEDTYAHEVRTRRQMTLSHSISTPR